MLCNHWGAHLSNCSLRQLPDSGHMCCVIAFHTIQPFKIDYRPCKRLYREAYSRGWVAVEGRWSGNIVWQCHATKCVSVNNVASSCFLMQWGCTHWLITHKGTNPLRAEHLANEKKIENLLLLEELFSSQLLSRHSCFALMSMCTRAWW